MSIKAQCSGCDAKFNVPDAAAGKSFLCKQCGEKVRVPIASEQPSASNGDVGSVFPVGFEQAANNREKRGLPMTPIALASGVLLLVLIAAVALTVRSGGGQRPEAETKPDIAEDAHASAEPEWLLEERREQERRREAFRAEQIARRQEAERLHRERDAEWERSLAHSEAELQKSLREREEARRGDRPRERTGHNAGPADRVSNMREQAEQTSKAMRKARSIGEKQRQAWSEYQSGFPVSPTRHTFEQDKGAFEELGPIGPWDVTPEAPNEKSLWKPRPRFELDINDRTILDTVLPVTHSRFIAVGDRSKRFVIDLSRGEPVWALKGSYGSSPPPDLSPDGNTYLFHSTLKHGTCFVSRTSRDQATPLNLQRVERRTLHWSGFVSNDTAVLIYKRGRGVDTTTILAVDCTTHSTRWVAELSDHNHHVDSVAVAPTGRYLALPTLTDKTPGVLILDTRTGEIAGRPALPEEVEYSPTGLAFSPDGSRLAGFYKKELLIWDLTNGHLVIHGKDQGSAPWFVYEEVRIQMLDNDTLIGASGPSGMRLCDALTGEDIMVAPEEIAPSQLRIQPSQKHARHLFAGMYLVHRDGYDKKAKRKKNTLSVGVLDPEMLASVKAATRFGGQAEEAELPLLEETFFYQASRSYLSNDPSRPYDAWPLDIQPAESIPARPTKERAVEQLPDLSPNLVKQAISRDGRFGYYSAGDFRLAKFDLETKQLVSSWRIKPDPTSLNKYELMHGRYGPHSFMDVFEVAEDRVWVLFRVGSTGDRACLIDTRTGQIVLGGGKVFPGIRETTHDRHYSLSMMGYGGTGSHVTVIDNQQGKAIGQLRTGGGYAVNFKVSPKGSRVAMIVRDGLMDYLVINDLKRNRVLHRNPIPGIPAHGMAFIDWADEERVFIQWRWLVQADTGRYLWEYDLGLNEPHKAILPHQDVIKKLVKAPPPLNKKSSHITKTFPFFREAMERAIAENPASTHAPALAVGPGTKVRVQTGGLRRAAEMRANLLEQVEAAGLVPVQDADQGTFTLRVTQKTKSIPRTFLAEGEMITVEEYEETTVFEWVTPAGDVIWSNKWVIPARLSGVDQWYRRGQNESPKQVIQKKIDELMDKRSVSQFEVPTNVPWGGDQQVIGKTIWDSTTDTPRDVINARP